MTTFRAAPLALLALAAIFHRVECFAPASSESRSQRLQWGLFDTMRVNGNVGDFNYGGGMDGSVSYTDTLASNYNQNFRTPDVDPPISSEIASVENKYYQLEELEDSDSSSTEIFLNPDRTVKVGESDGPVFSEATGVWKQDGDEFSMILSRRYGAGREASSFSDIGEFSFEVQREYRGIVTSVGASLALSGKIRSSSGLDDDDGLIIDVKNFEREVGFFNMIDVTAARGDAEVDGPP